MPAAFADTSPGSKPRLPPATRPAPARQTQDVTHYAAQRAIPVSMGSLPPPARCRESAQIVLPMQPCCAPRIGRTRGRRLRNPGSRKNALQIRRVLRDQARRAGIFPSFLGEPPDRGPFMPPHKIAERYLLDELD